ncbi:chromate efflux transporter [Desulfopila sp. IMCC35006]|uniref:chromate efflux transporter n=1 Tax=Desulfopila sp. IMCC35006 TaxID=2569542 RepID=UPI0010AC5651|nr:chromate efflux transporter [Desulfopila sp. IMCC35006]TKB23918.1 chromate efflux transporter [Desulfopila sp. IMCC35006]
MEHQPLHAPQDTPETAAPSFMEAFLFWLKLGWISFGGPAGQIAIMHQELVDRKKWISNEKFLHALNYCMLLPGPEAQQLATYIGWLLHKTKGGIVAGVLFVLPSVFILFGLSYVYVSFGTLPWVAAVFVGLKAAVLAIVLGAVIKIGKKSLKNNMLFALAAASFLVTYFLNMPFPVLILTVGIIGILGSQFAPNLFLVGKKQDNATPLADSPFPADKAMSSEPGSPFARNAMLLAIFGALWGLPLLALSLLLPGSIFAREALFFTKAAFLTFGGAYSLLGYIAQAGVEQYGWLTSLQMMDGLGLAETTPGPLIMVVQFVGFLAGWNHSGSLGPLFGAVTGSLVATYFTFLPSFLFIFLGAPYIEKLAGNTKMSAALATITPAVVGVVLNLGVWFGTHVLFPAEGFAWFSAILAIVSFWLMQFYKVGMISIIAGAGGLGLLWYLLGF